MNPILCVTVWSSNGVGNSLKAKPMCITKTVETNHPWWKVCNKQFAETALHNFEGEIQTEVTSWLQMAVDSYDKTYKYWCNSTINASNGGNYVEK